MQPPMILCLDDEESLLSLLEMVLKLNGYLPLPAANGRQALRLAATHRLDAAVLDYGLPDMTGAEVARELKRRSPDIPILLFTGAYDIPLSAVAYLDVLVRKSDGVNALLTNLESLTRWSPAKPLPRRRFRRYPAQLSFAIVANRSGEPRMYRGLSRDIGEGGIGGKVEGELAPNEFVLLHVSDSRLDWPLDPRAQVRYRNHETYGFEFVDVTPQQQNEVRRLCELLAAA
jgi:CheY-like chemotaxis protein